MRLTISDFHKLAAPNLIAECKSALKDGESLKDAVSAAAVKFFLDNEVIGEGDERLTADDIEIAVTEPRRKTAIKLSLPAGSVVTDDDTAEVIRKAVSDAMRPAAGERGRMNVSAGETSNKGSGWTIPATVHRVKTTAFTRGTNDERDRKAFAFGKFMHAIMGDEKSLDWCKAGGYVEGNIAQGGAFVPPPEFMADIIDLRDQYGVFPQYTRMELMSRDAMTTSKDLTGTSVYWQGEAPATGSNALAAASQAISLTAKKLIGTMLMSSEIVEDAAISVGDRAAMNLARAFAYKIDYGAFQGTASSTDMIYGYIPQLNGLGGTPPQIQVAETGTHANWALLTYPTLLRTRKGLSDAGWAGPNKRWFMTRQFFNGTVVPLVAAAGGNTKADLAGSTVDAIEGDPVVFVNVLPQVAGGAAEIVALYGDLSISSIMGDRRAFTLATSTEATVLDSNGTSINCYATDQMAVRATQRLDINIHDVGTATVAGSIAALKTAT